MFFRLGVKEAFGVSGGAMAALWDALSSSSLGVYHFRHETGAAFAAIEAGFASGRPTVLFTTTGPGLTNALTGIVAARDEGARVIVVSAYTSASSRGRFAIQETSRSTLPPSLYDPGRPFHFATVVDDPSQLAAVERALAAGLRRRSGFVAHVALDTAVQRAPAAAAAHSVVRGSGLRGRHHRLRKSQPASTLCVMAAFAIWVGYGARDAAAEIATLARRMQAPVMCSPRGKGIFPEDDPLFVGVTGLAGHASVMRYLEECPPRRVLVLGSRLGEPTSFWDRRFVAPEGFVHIDVDPDVPGVAFNTAPTLAVVGDVGATLRAVLAELRPSSSGGAMPRAAASTDRSCSAAQRRPGAPRSADGRPAGLGRRSQRRDGAVRSRQLVSVDDTSVAVFGAAPISGQSPGLGPWVTPPPVSSVRRWRPGVGRWRSSATAPC